MEQYSVLAKYYDLLMSDIDYKKWADFYEKCFEKFGGNVKKAVDIGCGTGSVTVELARRGYTMTGVDISAEMLSLAQKKAEDAGVFVRFAEQNMAHLDVGGSADAVICSLDGLNYLTKTDEISSCFCRVYETLTGGGVFVFDMNTVHKLKDVLGDNAFVYDVDDMFLSWQCAYNERSKTCDYYLTFFSEDGGVWRRCDEFQRQRAYSERTVEKMLCNAGFKILGKYADVDFSPAEKSGERIFYVCGKGK